MPAGTKAETSIRPACRRETDRRRRRAHQLSPAPSGRGHSQVVVVADPGPEHESGPNRVSKALYDPSGASCSDLSGMTPGKPWKDVIVEHEAFDGDQR